MSKSASIRIATFLLTALFIVPSLQAAMPALGSKAPDFTLRSNTGKNLKLSEYRGQVIMLNFWATWCAPCRQEMPQLNRLYEQYRKGGFVMLGVNIDDKSKAAGDLAQQLKLAFPVLFDADKQVSRRYDVDAMPSTLLIDRDGNVQYIHRGYRAGVEKEYDEKIRELLRK